MVIAKDAINTLVSIQPVAVSHTAQNTSQAPHPFNALPNGSLVEGFVINRDGQNNPILRTSAGDVLIATQVFLKTGTEVTLRVDNNLANHARIVTINGLSPEAFSRVQSLNSTVTQDSFDGVALEKITQGSAQNSALKPVQVQAVLLQPAHSTLINSALLQRAFDALGLSETLRKSAPVSAITNALQITIQTVQTTNFQELERSANPYSGNLATTSQSSSAQKPPASFTSDFSDSIAAQPAVSSRINKAIQPIQAEIARAALSNISFDDLVEIHQPNNSAKIPESAEFQTETPDVLAQSGLSGNKQNTAANTSNVEALNKPQNAQSQSIVVQAAIDEILPNNQSASTPTAITSNQSTISAQSLAPALISETGLKSDSLLKANPPSNIPNTSQGIHDVTSLLKSLPDQTSDSAKSKIVSPIVSSESPSPALTGSITEQSPAIVAADRLAAPLASAHTIEAKLSTAPTYTPSHVALGLNNTVEVDAVVIGRESGGDTIVQSPLGVIKLFTEKPVPVASILTLSISGNSQLSERIHASGLNTDFAEFTHLARDWQTLSQVLRSLQTVDPQIAASIVADILPNTGKNLAHGILFFLSAVKGGDIRNWLGNKNSRDIESKAPELLSRLGTDFLALNQASAESAQQGWMTTIIPLFHDQTLHQARLFIRQDQEQENSAHTKRSQGNRFIIEVELTQLGEMQFDGFVSKEASRHQFDMIIRSTRTLPLQIQQDIRTIYANAAEIAGFNGTLQFQNTPESFVRPLNSMRRGDISGIIA